MEGGRGDAEGLGGGDEWVMINGMETCHKRLEMMSTPNKINIVGHDMASVSFKYRFLVKDY